MNIKKLCSKMMVVLLIAALLLPSGSSPAVADTNITYSFDSTNNTLTITIPEGSDGVIDNVNKQKDPDSNTTYTTWDDYVEKIIIDGDLKAIGTISEDRNNNNNWGTLFWSWQQLKTVEYTGSTPFIVGDNAFNSCGQLETFPFDYVSSIGVNGFTQAGFSEVTLNNLTGDIGDSGFYNIQNLTQVTIHAQGNNTYIGENAFGMSYSSNTQSLGKVTITGAGKLTLGGKKYSSGTFQNQKNLTTVDFTGFNGDIVLEEFAFSGDSALKEIELSGYSNISYIGYGCFSGCSSLSQDFLDFSKLNGVIARAGFGISHNYEAPEQATGPVSGLESLNLSNVKEIGAFAFTAERSYTNYGYKDLKNVNLNNVERVHSFAFQGAENVDWNQANIPKTAKLAYSDVFANSDVLWQRFLGILDDRFSLLSDDYGSQKLEPSDSGWEDIEYGTDNATTNGSTQLTKAAKWTNAEKTEAQVEIRASYAPRQQMDFVFVLDTSTSMSTWYDVDSENASLPLPAQGDAQYAKMYEMQSKVADVTEKLLSSEQVESRVAIAGFGSTINFASQGSEKINWNAEDYGFDEPGFYTKDDLDQVKNDIRYMPCKGNTYYCMGLLPATKFVKDAEDKGRNLTVIFLSDGKGKDKGNPDAYAELTSYIEDITSKEPEGYGRNIIGVLYNPAPTDQDRELIDEVCKSGGVYLAKDTEGFSEAINQAIYTALADYTLTDVINNDFDEIPVDEANERIKVDGGTFTLDPDGRTIHWDLTGTEPYKAYTMTIDLNLAKDTITGTYPFGTFPTNDGNAKLADKSDLDNPVNQVEPPELSRKDEVTLQLEEQTIYTGGKDGDAVNNEFPIPIYLMDGTPITSGSVSFTAKTTDGGTWSANEKTPYPFTVEYYDGEGEELKEIENDECYGDYVAKIVPLDNVDKDSIKTFAGQSVVFEDSKLRIRYVSSFTEASDNLMTADAVEYDSSTTQEAAKEKVEQANEKAGVVLAADTKIYLNGKDKYEYPDTAPCQIALFFDELLPPAKGQSNETYKNDLIEHAEDKGFSFDGKQSEFRYLDLVDTNDSNAWVSSSKGSDVFWRYPEGTDKNTEFQLLHFENLHREYGMTGEDKLQEQIAASPVEEVKIEKTDAGIWFHVPEAGFSPFALLWGDDETDTPGTQPPGSDTPDLNTVDHYSYIVGYPEDYRTGEPTEDKTLWPVKPQGNITRAEVATIFYRLLTDEARAKNWTQSNDYTDVEKGHWFNTPVSTLSEMGIIAGYEDGSFRPNSSITRAEFASIAVRFFEEKSVDYEMGSFIDIQGDEWYADAIQAAKEYGIVGGYPDGSFQPNDVITRAEACSIVNRTLKRIPDKDHLLPESLMRVWPDNADVNAWYYEDMQEATSSHEYEWITSTGDDEWIEEWTGDRPEIDWDEVERELCALHGVPYEG